MIKWICSRALNVIRHKSTSFPFTFDFFNLLSPNTMLLTHGPHRSPQDLKAQNPIQIPIHRISAQDPPPANINQSSQVKLSTHSKQKQGQQGKAYEQHIKVKKGQSSELDPTAYYQNRSNAIHQLKQGQNTDPYPHSFHTSKTLSQFKNCYQEKCKEPGWIQQEESVAGRVRSIRKQGKSLVFYDIEQEGCSLQVVCNASFHPGGHNQSFLEVHNGIRRGDIVGVVGRPGRSRTNELSIAPGTLKLLAPCLHMLPDPHSGFKDRESRYRKRYLDLMVNARTRQTFILRARIIEFLRNYLAQKGFIEVETPMMNTKVGGATAKTFLTHHNDLNMSLCMRVAPELYLKMCVIGGLERVFEIGKNFRNESIDQTHNPQFTSCEFYCAYKDYNDLMELTQDLLSNMVKDITGSYLLSFHPEPDTNPQKVVEIDYSRPWRRISMMEELAKCLGQPMPDDLTTKDAEDFFRKQCIKHKVECSEPRTTSRLIDKLVGHFLESQCLNPTFIIDHPQLMSPLAKNHRSKPGMTQRFELFIKHSQLCNAYTELNDPFLQKSLLLKQAQEKEKGDDESMHYDEAFVEALQHGLPPTAGWGLGIDRLVMLLTDHIRIQEVLLFPAMRPAEKDHVRPQ